MCMRTFDVSGPSSGRGGARSFHRRLQDQRQDSNSDALPTTHNEMGLPVDVLSEKREMQV